MKTSAVRLYGADDLRLETFELPEIKDDEILVKVISDSICMSTYKLLRQGKAHKRCPQNVDTNPIIVGHEFAGDIVQVGAKWAGEFTPGEKFAQQPALNYQGKLDSPGYSYEWFGGSTQYAVIPHEVMELGCLLHYSGESYFEASLGEPMSCIIGGYNANYHTNKVNYIHQMGVKPGGSVLILGGAGPMGLGAVEYPLAIEAHPARVVVTDVDAARIERARRVIPESHAAERGVELHYVNSAELENQREYLMSLTDGKGYDDVFVFAPIEALAELGDSLLAFDGCMNVFAGPSDSSFSAKINLYNSHYTSTHIMGTTGGNTDDLKEGLRLSEQGLIRPSVMITHIGGIDSIIDTVTNLPHIPGGKKLTYPCLELPLTAIEDFGKSEDPLFQALDAACQKHKGLWNAEAEGILLRAKGVI
ncbi:MAG: zinc-binding dehydrogenase [Propionibacteriaceae bacterium]|jgi:threonine dehydrogenase-like Zn-dependent dehydrogenase|nr:zinc-binding dehydrogenase [Propionibacteriaceae bacterium]